MGLADDVVSIRRNLSRLALEHGRRAANDPRDDLLPRAVSLEHEARRLRKPQLIAATLLQRGELLLAADRAQEAISVLKDVTETLGDLRKADLHVRALAYLAEAYGRLKQWNATSAICEEGIALVEAYRYKLSADYLSSAYMRSRIGLYSWGVRAAYELGGYKLAIERAELSKCRLILGRHSRPARATTPDEVSREGEFRDICRQIAGYPVGKAPEQLVVRRAMLWDWMNIGTSGSALGPFSLGDAQCLLESEEAVLFYYWLDRNSLMIATIDQRDIAVEIRDISCEQREILDAYASHVLTSVKPNYSALEPVQKFGSFLLPKDSPVAWHKKQSLLVSPHRVLHSIPFHAMRYGNEWLIERAAVSYIANLSSLTCSYVTSKKPRILVVGIEHFDVRGKKLGALPEAELEAQEVKLIYDNQRVPVTLLLETDATAQRLRELERDKTLESYSCLHFATHGENVNSDSPMESHFYLQDSILDGLELANLQIGAETVVLSACCSGQRPTSGRGLKELPGDDLFGIQAAFFQAGARRILGTLWPVESAAARRVAIGFHARLAGDRPCKPEKALQESVIDFLSQADIQTKNVYFWAPFFLSVLGRPKSN